jgi:large subunit ribosomal protein L3
MNKNYLVFEKIGMTRYFDEAGVAQPVTVLKLPKSIVQPYGELSKIAVLSPKKSNSTKSISGQVSNCPDGWYPNFIYETTVSFSSSADPLVSLAVLKGVSIVNVSGVSKGKGFQGVIKRYGFSGGPGAHGSQFHRRTGSIGNRATPARVFAEKKMPGHMGCENVKVKNLRLCKLDIDLGVVMVAGSVPGAKNSYIKIYF